jgi:hypothetical protein
MKNILKKTSLILCASAAALAACNNSEDSKPVWPGEKTFSFETGWECNGSNCQDVFDFSFIKNSKVTFKISEVSGSSMVQIALYKEEDPLGGTNLFTDNNQEVTCFLDNDCDAGAAGYTITDFLIQSTGTYRFAVTRNHGMSCGWNGGYKIDISANTNFEFKEQSVDDESSLAAAEPLQVCED